MDGARYENARWWRNLNRGMSLLGILILAAVVSHPPKTFLPARVDPKRRLPLLQSPFKRRNKTQTVPAMNDFVTSEMSASKRACFPDEKFHD